MLLYRGLRSRLGTKKDCDGEK